VNSQPASPNTWSDAWIVERRPARHAVDPWRPYLFFAEEERSRDGQVAPVSTILLTNRECPWRCLMCDLWKNTLAETVPLGAIPAQIEYALARLPEAKTISMPRHVKLYNSGSFFDPRAIPPADYGPIAARLAAFEHAIVESHPALVGEPCLRFRDLLAGSLEVAMGLETVHPAVLARLNKHMTVEQFRDAALWLTDHEIDVRVFILVKPPFLREDEALEWANRSLDFAFACGATAATLIPTRAGNGAMDALAIEGDFAPPSIGTLEAALEYGLRLAKGRVFADLWDLSRFARCRACYQERAARLRRMNLEQAVGERVACRECGGSG
jgi:radical SAM enzyme (TIGR01210 family)